MSSLKVLKKVYDKLGNDYMRCVALNTADHLKIRKDIIRMDTNNICNIKCIMCNEGYGKNEAHIMSLDDFKTVIDSISKTARILYLSCSYEPLATPHFEEYIKYAKASKIPFISLCTNALLLNQGMAQCLVDNKVDEIIVSFNGFCKEDYEHIMKGSSFDTVCDNLRMLREYKRSQKTEKPRVRINSILMKTNLLSLDKLFPFLDEKDIDTIQFRELSVYKGQNNPEEVKDELISGLSQESYEQISDGIKVVAEKIKAEGKEIILPEKFWKFSNYRKPHEDVQKEADISISKKANAHKTSCSIPFFSYWIDCYGGMRICRFDNQSIIGNILEDKKESMVVRSDDFRKLALAGGCCNKKCRSNIDSSVIV